MSTVCGLTAEVKTTNLSNWRTREGAPHKFTALYCLRFALAGLLFTSAAHAASFTGIGNPEGGRTQIFTLSDDGKVAGGMSSGGLSDHGFLWSNSTGTQIINEVGYVDGMNSDGTVYVGAMSLSAGRYLYSSGDYTAFPYAPGFSDAAGVDSSGKIVSGTSSDGATPSYLKNTQTGVVTNLNGSLHDASRNGAFAVGSGFSMGDSSPVYWNLGNGGTLVSMIAGPQAYTRVSAVNNAGTLAFGVNATSSDVGMGGETANALVWNGLNVAPTVLVNPAGLLGSELWVTNATGSMAGGWGYNAAGDSLGVLWDAINGLRLASYVLITSGADLTGWQITEVTGISADGLTIAGNGLHNGMIEGWVFTAVPEPSTYAFTSLSGLMVIAAIRRMKRRVIAV